MCSTEISCNFDLNSANLNEKKSCKISLRDVIQNGLYFFVLKHFLTHGKIRSILRTYTVSIIPTDLAQIMSYVMFVF